MDIDWEALFVPKVSLIELVLRGTVMYMALFALLRVLVRRHVGALSLTDMLVIVLIADAAQNAMASEYRSLPEGLVLCATIIGWSYAFDWLAFRYSWIRRLLEPPPLPLVRNGRLQRRNLRQELVTIDELMSHLREQGIDDVREVRAAYIEPDGQISVIKKEPGQGDSGPTKKHLGAT
jgi:uncharacterized membrane protein YcaP (DUF421 family)